MSDQFAKSSFSYSLCRQIGQYVLIAVIVVNATLFVPFYFFAKKEFADQVETASRIAVTSAYAGGNVSTLAEFRRVNDILLRQGALRGGILFNADGREIFRFGQAPDSAAATSGSDIDVVWSKEQLGVPYRLAARLDSERVTAGVMSLLMKLLGPVLLITALVVFAAMRAARRRFAVPIMALEDSLARAGNDAQNCDRYALENMQDDGLGKLIAATNHLFKRVSASRRDSVYALKAMADRSEVAILTYDANGKLYYANRACIRMCGYGSLDEMAQAPPPRFSFASQPHPETLLEVLGTGLVSRDATLIDAEGNGTAILLNGARMPEDLKTPVRFYATIVDVTALRESQAQLEQQNMDLLSASKAKSEFLANMSHELRTPLNAIIGFSEIIMNESFGPVGHAQYKEYSGDINDSGTHLLTIINDILDLSKIEAGKMALNESETVISDVVNTVVRIIQERAHNAKIELITKVPDGLPKLYADERSVKQMLINLLSNAVKFTPEGGTVVVAVEYRKGSIILGVADTGIGMTEEDAKIALEPFRQVDGSHTRTQEGTGLGLPLVRALIRQHKGRLRIDSGPGKGTMVTLGFPAERTVLPQKKMSATESPEGETPESETPKSETPKSETPETDPFLALASGKFVA